MDESDSEGEDFTSEVTLADSGAPRWSVEVDGDGLDSFRVVFDSATIVGRERGAGVFVPRPGVAARHLRLVPSRDGVIVQRLSDESFVLRGVRDADQALARDGETVQIAEVLLRLRLVDRDRRPD